MHPRAMRTAALRGARRARASTSWTAPRAAWFGAPPAHPLAAPLHPSLEPRGGGGHADLGGSGRPTASLNIPYVIESTAKGERGYDIFSRLLLERIVTVNGAIDDTTSALVVAQLLYLEAQSQEAPIHVYINSPGGVVTAGLAIYDTMQYVQPPVATICLGQACSMASLLLAGGAAGMRRALPNARVMVHQPHGGVQGQASDIALHTRELLGLKERLYALFSVHTGRSVAEIEGAMDRDNFMSAEEAVAFGLVDEVAHRHPPAAGPAARPTPGAPRGAGGKGGGGAEEGAGGAAGQPGGVPKGTQPAG